MIDANFDGNNDLQIFQVKGTAGVLYYFWIYNTETKTFEQNPVLGNITSPEFDLKNKIIYSSSRLHPGERVDKYKYVNKKTVLFESTENAIRTDKNGNRLFVTTIRKRINGKMQITSKIINPD